MPAISFYSVLAVIFTIKKERDALTSSPSPSSVGLLAVSTLSTIPLFWKYQELKRGSPEGKKNLAVPRVWHTRGYFIETVYQ